MQRHGVKQLRALSAGRLQGVVVINAYLKDSLTVVRHGAVDQYGTEGATTAEAAAGFVEWKTRLVRNIKGEEVRAAASILMWYDSTLTHEDRIRIGAVEYPIIAIEIVRDFTVRGMRVYI